MSKTTNKFSTEVRARAVRMGLDHKTSDLASDRLAILTCQFHLRVDGT